MHISFDRPEIILKWGTRLLYIQVFIALLVLQGNWNNPQTFPYIGSVLCLVFSALFFIKEDEEEVNESKKIIKQETPT